MKQIHLLLILCCLVLNLSAQRTIRVLAIGNSFSADALENYLYDLGKNQDVTFIIGNLYIGGSSLETHWNNSTTNKASYSYRKINALGVQTTTAGTTLLQGIKDEAWDYISVQQNSGNSGIVTTYFPYLTDLLTFVKSNVTNPAVKYIFHQTWAYAGNSTHADFTKYEKNQEKMYNAIVNTVIQATDQVGINIVVPAGTAIQNGRTSILGDTFCRDGYHLDMGVGRFTASCTWYEILTGFSAVDNTFRPASLTQTEARIAKEAAHYAVLQPHSTTKIEIGAPEITALTDPVNIDFGAVTATSTEWNYFGSSTLGSNVVNLTDTKGKETGIIIEVNAPFNGANASGPTATTTALNMPTNVSQDCLWSDALGTFSPVARPEAGFIIKNLDKTATYKFSFFGSRMSSTDNRETLYKVVGATQDSAALNTSNNSGKIVTVTGIRPTAEGQISIIVKPGANNNNLHKFYYINALQIQNDPQTAIKKNGHFTDNINVFPNPFTTNININAPNGIKYVSLYSLLGIEVLQAKMERAADNQIFIDQLPKGSYLLKIRDLNGKTSTFPILKR